MSTETCMDYTHFCHMGKSNNNIYCIIDKYLDSRLLEGFHFSVKKCQFCRLEDRRPKHRESFCLCATCRESFSVQLTKTHVLCLSDQRCVRGRRGCVVVSLWKCHFRQFTVAYPCVFQTRSHPGGHICRLA